MRALEKRLLRWGLCFSCGAASLAPLAARADEPRSATEPRVMMESGEVTNVIDAFDDGDQFDLNVSLDFSFQSKSAKILRETAIPQAGLATGGYTSRLMNVGQYSSQLATLTPRIDIGLYHDLAIYARLPIILSYSQKIDSIKDKAGVDTGDHQATILAGNPGEQLFSLPFKSPDRSGIDYLALGFDFDIFNQARDRSKPTWLFGAEARIAIGDPMHACNPAVTGLPCAAPGDINRTGKNDNQYDAADLAARQAGVTRGTIGLEVHTILSKRAKYIEPYGGFSALVEFYNSDDFKLTQLDGSLVNHPPIHGKMILGTMIIPWENREKFARFTLDFRFTGEYVSEGRDYSELFDALGSSSAPSLRNPEWASYKANPNFDQDVCNGTKKGNCVPRSVVDEGSQKTFNTGLTDVYAHGTYRGSIGATWQASEYVKFSVGGGLRFDQGHIITGDQPCNPAFKDDIGKSGPCHSGNDTTQAITSTGIPNPNYRPSINLTGQRFYVDNSMTWDLGIAGTVMF
jgi:hypothetical protein